jgi:hypothetical protein
MNAIPKQDSAISVAVNSLSDAPASTPDELLPPVLTTTGSPLSRPVINSAALPTAQPTDAPADTVLYDLKQARASSAFVPGGQKRYGFKRKPLILSCASDCLHDLDYSDRGAMLFTFTVNPDWNPDPAALYDRIRKDARIRGLLKHLRIKDYLFAVQFTENGYFHFHGLIPYKSLPSGYYNPVTGDFRFERPAKPDGYQKRRHFFDLQRCKKFLAKHRIGQVSWLSPRATTWEGYARIVDYMLADLFEETPIPGWVLERSCMHYFTKGGCFRSLEIRNSNSQGKPKARRSERGPYKDRARNRTYAEIAADNNLKVNIFYSNPGTGKTEYQQAILGHLPSIAQFFPGVVRYMKRNHRTGEEYPAYGFDSEDAYQRCLEYHEDPAKVREFQRLRAKKLRAYHKRAKGDPLAVGARIPRTDGSVANYIYHPGFDDEAIYHDLRPPGLPEQKESERPDGCGSRQPDFKANGNPVFGGERSNADAIIAVRRSEQSSRPPQGATRPEVAVCKNKPA